VVPSGGLFFSASPASVARGAGLVVDDDIAPGALLQGFGNEARHHVRAAAGRKADQDLQGLVGQRRVGTAERKAPQAPHRSSATTCAG